MTEPAKEAPAAPRETFHVYECSDHHRFVSQAKRRDNILCGRCSGLRTFEFIGSTSQAEEESETHARYRAALTEFDKEKVS